MARILDDWLASFMQYCERIETPKLYKYWVGIFTIASVLERKCWLEWDKNIFPNMYVLLIGSAAARKGTAMHPGLSLLCPLEAQGKITLASNSGSMQGLLKAMCQAVKEVPDYPPEMNTTQMSCMTAFSQEFSTMMGTNNLDYCNILTDLYDCGDPRGEWKYETRQAGEEFIQGPWLNLIGAIQPEVLPSIFPKEVIFGGFTSRFMMIYGEKPKEMTLRPRRTPAEKALMARLQADLDVIHTLRGPFQITDEAQDLLDQWRIEAEVHPPLVAHEFEAYIGRRPTHLLKLCLALTASQDDRMVIDAQVITRAIKIMEFTEARMSKVYEGNGSIDWVAYIPALQKFLLKKGGRASLSDISAQFYKNLKPLAQTEMLQQLHNRGDVELFIGEDTRRWVRLVEAKNVPQPFSETQAPQMTMESENVG